MPVTLALKLTWILNICCFPIFHYMQSKWFYNCLDFLLFICEPQQPNIYIHKLIWMMKKHQAVGLLLFICEFTWNTIDGETSSVLLRPLKRHLITHCACNTAVTLDRLWRFVCVYVCVFSWMCAKRASLREPVLYSSTPTSAPEHLERECGRLQKAVVVWGQR